MSTTDGTQGYKYKAMLRSVVLPRVAQTEDLGPLTYSYKDRCACCCFKKL